MIKIIYDESQRMGRLVTDLLNLARMESGNMKLYKEKLSVNFVFERITQKFAQVAKEKQISLVYKSDFTEDEKLSMDEDRVEQVSKWYSKMISKAADGSWQIAIGTAANLLTQSLNSFYGL